MEAVTMHLYHEDQPSDRVLFWYEKGKGYQEDGLGVHDVVNENGSELTFDDWCRFLLTTCSLLSERGWVFIDPNS